MKGRFYPSNLVVVDTETKPKKINNNILMHELVLGVAQHYKKYTNYHLKQEKVFTTQKEFWEFLQNITEKEDNVYVVAHNATFDLLALGYESKIFHEYFKDWIPTMFIPDKFRFIVRYQKGKKELIFMDSANFFNTSLEKIGKMLKFEKMENPIMLNGEVKEELIKTKWKELIKYCRRDVEITAKIMIEFINFLRKHRWKFKLTIASQSFEVWRRVYRGPIAKGTPVITEELVRKAYRGGLTDLFKRGTFKNVYYVDVNSMYPFVMKEYEYPTNMVAYFKGEQANVMWNKLKDSRYLYIFKFKGELKKGVVPQKVRAKIDGQISEYLLLLEGKGIFYMTNVEYEAFKDYIVVEKVEEIAFYEKHKIFAKFVEYFYAKRLKAKEEGNEVYSQFYKILMNSLYGKFAQRVRENMTIEEENDIDGLRVSQNPQAGLTEINFPHHTLFITSQDKFSKRYFAPISAFTTAYARVYLMKAIEIAKDVYYTDTDSLFTSKEGFERLKKAGLVDNKKLGAFKLEDIFTEITFYAPKSYEGITQDGRYVKKLKGVNKKAIEVGENKYKVMQSWSIPHVRKENLTGPVFNYLIKEVKNVYRKGKVEGEDIIRYSLGELDLREKNHLVSLLKKGAKLWLAMSQTNRNIYKLK